MVLYIIFTFIYKLLFKTIRSPFIVIAWKTAACLTLRIPPFVIHRKEVIQFWNDIFFLGELFFKTV